MPCNLLNRIRILDLTMVFAGPVCTKILAEMGAEVIKIESVQRSDVFTRANVYPENIPGEKPWDRGCIFHTLNAGKRGISLNMGNEKGRDLFKRLVRISDAVVENYSPRVMDNWGLGYEELKKIKPDIIMVSMSGLGHYGPLKDFYMYVPGMEGMSGLTYNTGLLNEKPLLSGHAYGDWVTGVNAAAALMISLFYRQRSNKGQYVDVSGREAVACHIGDIIMDYTLNKRDRKRVGNRDSSTLQECYRCQGDDSWVNITIETEDQWQLFCQATNNPAWALERRFATTSSRRQNQEELDRLIEDWTLQHGHIEVMQILQAAGIPAGAVLDMKEINLDPHLSQRGFFQLINHGEGVGKRPIIRQMPAKFNSIESSPNVRAPRFAQDNQYVYGSLLGLSEGEIEKLEQEGVLGKSPTFPKGRPTQVNLVENQGAGWFDSGYLTELSKIYGNDIGNTSPS
jgi:benzylsuccinate CoA-transferase BbsF subunit